MHTLQNEGVLFFTKNSCFSGSKMSHPNLYILTVECLYIEVYVTVTALYDHAEYIQGEGI